MAVARLYTAERAINIIDFADRFGLRKPEDTVQSLAGHANPFGTIWNILANIHLIIFPTMGAVFSGSASA